MSKRKNSSEAALEHKQLMLTFIDPEGCNLEISSSQDMTEEEFQKEMDDYDYAIAEAQGMIDYFKEHNNSEEVAFWRQMLQENKTAKRLMREKHLKEVAAA